MGRPGAHYDLARLLAPFDVDAFKREHWEKSPRIIRRDDRLYYRELLSFEGIDEILSTSSLGSGDIRIVRDGRESHPSSLLVGEPWTLGLEHIYAEYRQGSTIVLQFVHHRWRPLMKLCAALSEELSAGFQVNAYLTPRNARGLGVHYDTHDVFVLQVEGSKHWRLFESPEGLPLPGQLYQKDIVACAIEQEAFDLNAGDLLYIPRGIIHEAVSMNSSSLHLTVGVLPITWAEVILAAVESVIERDSRFRESLQLGFARREAPSSQAEARLTELVNLLVTEISPEAAIRDAIDRAWLRRKPILDGHLLDLETETSVSLATLVQRRPEIQWRLGKDGEDVYLHFHGKNLRMPGYVEPDLRFIGQTEEPFTGASLPSEIDEEGRLVLIRRLLREGFLTRESPG